MEAIQMIQSYKVPELVGYTRNKHCHKIFGLHKFETV